MKTFYIFCITLLFSISINDVYSQCPANLDFENGTKSGWQCLSGSVSGGNITVAAGACKNPNNAVNPPLRDVANSSTPSVNQQAIMSAAGGVDINSGLPVVAPGGGKYSLRIGDGTGGNGTMPGTPSLAVGASYTMQVTPQNAGLTYMYAVVMCEADGNSPHSTTEAPRFEVILKDFSGNKIDCGSYNVEATTHDKLHKGAAYTETGGTPGGGGAAGTWWYSDWTSVTINLKSFVNQWVTLEFRVSDCNPGGQRGGHGAYAYIDAKCDPMLIKAPIICAQAEVEACAPDGYKEYQWQNTNGKLQPPLNQKCVKIKGPKPGEKYVVKLIPFSNSNCQDTMVVTLVGLKVEAKDVTLCPTTTKDYVINTTVTPSNSPVYQWTSLPAGAVINTPTSANPSIPVPDKETKYIVVAKDINGCTASDTVTVKINCTIGIELNGGEVCEGKDGCVDLTAKVTGGKEKFKYKWTPSVHATDADSAGPFKVCPKETTTYSVTVTDAMGLTATATNVVIVNPKPKLTATSATVCKGSKATLSVTSSDPSTTFTWKPAGTLNTSTEATVEATPDITTTYTIIGKTDKGCIDSTTSTVYINNYIKIDAGLPQTICAGDSTVQLNATGPANTEYNWTGPGIKYTSIQNPIAYPPVGKTTYVVNAVDPSGCPGRDSVEITVNPMPIAKFVLDKYQGCVPLLVNITNTSTAPLGSTSRWDFGDPKADPKDNPNTIITKDLKVKHDYRTVGVFTIKLWITTPAGCKDSTLQKDTVRTFPYPTAEFTLNPYETDTWKPTINYFDQSIGHDKTKLKWYLQPDSTKIVSEKSEFTQLYKEAGTYYMCLKVVTDHGCPDEICHPAVVKPDWSFFIPNAFTPNGDGKNEKFNGVGVNILEYRMDIFDRWGLHICTINTVDTQDNRGNGWDGTVDGGSGEKQQEDCYVYKVRLTDIFHMKHEYIGRVTLIK